MGRRIVLFGLVPALLFGWTWSARHSSAGAAYDRAQAVATDPLGNAYVTGYVTTAGTGKDFITIKYSPTGTVLWQHQFGSASDDAGVAIAYDPVTAGVLVTGPSGGDFLTIKYDALSGDTVWTRRYNGPASGSDSPAALCVDNLGYVCVAGRARVGSVDQAVVVKYSPAGLQSWATLVPSTYGDGSSMAAAVAVSPSRNIYIGGSCRDLYGTYDIMVARVLENGTLDWRQSLDGPANNDDIGTAVAVDDSGHVVVAGAIWAGTTMDDYMVAKFSATGSLRWTRTYNGPVNDEDWPTAVVIAPNFTSYVTGWSVGVGNDEDYLTISFDKDGNQRWSARYTGQGNDQDSATAIAVRGNRVYVTGFSVRAGNPEVATVGYDTLGNQLWVTRYYNSPPFDDEALAIAVASDGVFYVTGESHADASGFDLLTLKYCERDFGVVAITAPQGTMPPRPVAPQATIRNYGVKAETAAVRVRIFQGSTPVYDDIQYVYGLAANSQQTVAFKAFTGGEGDYTIRCSTGLTGDLYHQNDTASGVFTFRWTVMPGWVQMRSVPGGPLGKAVKDGASLCYGRHNASRFSVFALKGNGTNEFYRFDIAGDSWVTLESLRYSGSKRKAVKKGAALAYDRYDTLVFALKGNGTSEFWKYDIIRDTWIPLETMPIGPDRKRLKGGSGLAFYRHTPSGQYWVYAMKGSKTFEFYAFHVQGDSWVAKRPMLGAQGASRRGMGDGSCLINAGGTLYALKGGHNEFFQYDMEKDTWYEKRSLPIVGAAAKKRKAKLGTALAYNNNVIYCLKGGSTEFWAYYTDVDTWVELESMPRVPNTKVVKGGGALAFGDGRVWAFRGNKTFDFYAYNIGSDADRVSRLGEGVASRPASDGQRFAITLGPNPLRSGFACLNTGPIGQAGSISIYDALGRRVFTLPVYPSSPRTQSLDLRQLPAGVYLVKLWAGSEARTQKLVIEK